MNKLRTSSRYFINAVLASVLFSACTQYGTDYTYKWKVKVIYTNGDIDTLDAGRSSFKGNEVNLYLSSNSGDAFHSGDNAPCLKVSCGFYDSVVTCGVRKYEILEFNKVVLNSH